MKRYEAPVVELTKFDIEDVITASADPIDALDYTNNHDAALEAAGKIEGNTTNTSAYTGGIFAW